MKFATAVLAAFLGGVLAIAVLLAYRLSSQTGNSLTEVFAGVPGDARLAYSDMRSRAGETVESGKQVLKQRQDAVLGYVRRARSDSAEGTDAVEGTADAAGDAD